MTERLDVSVICTSSFEFSENVMLPCVCVCVCVCVCDWFVAVSFPLF